MGRVRAEGEVGRVRAEGEVGRVRAEGEVGRVGAKQRGAGMRVESRKLRGE